MSDAKSNYLETALLDHVLRNTAYSSPATVYLALYTDNPTDANSGTEVTGGSYARQAMSFAAASGGSISTNTAETFTALPTATITHFGILDASSGGNLLYYGAFSSTINVSSGDSLTIASGNITITES